MSDQTPNPKFAWRDIPPKGLPKRSATDRVSDFLEIYGLYDEETAREQASRCIQCPNPTCVGGCPLCNPIPQWMLLTAEGRFLEAAAVLGSVSNMAEVCSRMCPQERMCEEACILNSVSEPVHVRDIEQFLAEYAAAHGHGDVSTAPPNGRRVAVVGSGPGGLACADELAKLGHAVTIFDAALVPGGLLVDGTPAFKLEKSIVERRLRILEQRGVKFRLGAQLGQTLSLTELRTNFDAVYLGFDSRQARPVELPGASLRGVVQAMAFMLEKTTAVSLDSPAIDVEGKRVVILGLGDSAVDCARTALRYGATKVTCVYRRGPEDKPCAKNNFEAASEEGVQFLFYSTPVEILGDDSGSVRAVRFIATQPGDREPSGRRTFTPQPEKQFDVDADCVIAAFGFMASPCPHTGDCEELAINEWGGLVVDDKLSTNLRGVFAGGDIVRGPCHVLEAVRDARTAAAAIHQAVCRRL
jgi:glutamate synthase (NADPH/NADH) small chain